MVVFREKYKAWEDKNCFYSLYDSEGVIIGTQWLPAEKGREREKENDTFL